MINERRSPGRVSTLQRVVGALAGAACVFYGTRGVLTGSLGATRIPIQAYLHGGDAVLAGLALAVFGYAIARFAAAPLLRRGSEEDSDWKVLVVPGFVICVLLAGLALRFALVAGPHVHESPIP